MESLYKENEIKSKDLDLDQIVARLNQKEIDYDKAFAFEQKVKDSNFNETEAKKL